MKILSVLPTLLLLLLTATAQAEEPSGHILTLSASAETTVPNDEVILTFQATAQSKYPSEVVRKVNTKMQAAVEAAQEIQNEQHDLEIQTGNYQVTPIYDKNRLTYWQGKQTLILKIQNPAHLQDALAQIEAILPYQSIQYRVSTKAQQAAQNTLIPQAIEALKTRAKLAMQGFHAKQAVPLSTHIHTQTPMRVMSSRLASTGTTILPGKSMIKVSIDGKFQLIY